MTYVCLAFSLLLAACEPASTGNRVDAGATPPDASAERCECMGCTPWGVCAAAPCSDAGDCDYLK